MLATDKKSTWVILFVCVFLFYSIPVWAIYQSSTFGNRSGVGAGSSYIGCTGADWCEDAETGTYPYGWDGEQETNGTAGEYTGTYKYGAKAISCTYGASDDGNANVYEQVAGGGQSDLWIIGTFWMTSNANWGSTDYITLVYFQDSGCSSFTGEINIIYDGSNYTLQATNGTVTSNPKTTNLSENTAYVIKGRIQTGTGSDGQMDVWIKEPGGEWTHEIDINNGDNTTDSGCIKTGVYYYSWGNDGVLIMDDFGYDDDGDPDP